MKKFWIGLLTGALAVPAIFFGTTAIVAKNNDRTMREQLQQIVAEETVETEEDTTTEDETVVEDETQTEEESGEVVGDSLNERPVTPTDSTEE